MSEKRKLRCGVCNVYVEDWYEHVKSEQHQKYLNDPTLVSRMFSGSQANIFRAMIGAKKVPIKPSDPIDKKNPYDLWNWHVAVRGSGCDVQEIRKNVKAIFLFLQDKYGQSDYRTICTKDVLEKGAFDSKNLERIRYIIHAETEGITHETDDAHGSWLKVLKRNIESKR